MTPNRIASGVLTFVLLTLLGWSIFAGAGDARTWIVLGMGSALGALYTAYGQIPDWIIQHSGGSITDDNDPSNLSPRFYLPILVGAIVMAIVALVLVIRFL